MDQADYKEVEQLVAELRSQVISRFAGMTVDMNYNLCIPSVHAVCGDEDIVVDFNGITRRISGAFPSDIARMLSKWAKKHGKDIQKNHSLLNSEHKPLNPIDPPANK
ncbi:MAG: hypothetical protein II873_02015 [Oscillospiraceae bacterium]|nr:hypothetical protein [Oscillospiraceae bacterium]